MKILLFLFFPLACMAQAEKLAMNVDKTVCNPGDTLWLAGFLQGTSTNCHIRVLDSASDAVFNGTFVVYRHQIEGQIVMPKKPGSYWVQAYTQGSNAWSRSILVRDSADSLLIINRQYRRTVDTVVHLIGGADGLLIQAPYGAVYSVSVSKGSAAAYIEDTVREVISTYDTMMQAPDTNYITLLANVQTKCVEENDYIHLTLENDNTVEAQKRRALEKREIFLSGAKATHKRKVKDHSINLQDSLPNLDYILPIDSTKKFILSNLMFFGKAYLHYQLAVVGPHAKDYTGFTLDSPKTRLFVAPRFKVDTVDDEPLVDTFDRKHGYLKAFVKKRKIPWQIRNAKLQAQYQSPSFEDGSHFSRADFSCLAAAAADSDEDIGHWLVDQSPLLYHMNWDNSLAYPGIYFWNEQQVGREWFCQQKVKDVAYVNDLRIFCISPPCPPNWLCAWSRDGISARFSGNANVIPLHGYVPPLKWTTPDRHGLLWEPFVDAEYYRLPNIKRPFTITVVGRLKDSRVFTYQTTMDN